MREPKPGLIACNSLDYINESNNGGQVLLTCYFKSQASNNKT